MEVDEGETISIFRRPPRDGEAVIVEPGHENADVTNYQLLNSIGVGAYAKVYRAQVKSTNVEVASKIINRRGAPKDYVKKFLPREIDILQKLDHPQCITTYEIFEHNYQIHMIMELASNGDLLDYINSRGRIAEPTSQKIFSQLVSALDYFYSINVAHRDLKCENLLLDANFNIKVSDFGFATPYTDGQLLRTFCGSVAYACPEILYGQPYNGRTSDLWSIGVVLYALVCGQLPFQEGDMKRLLLQINSPLIFPSRLSSECIDLLRRLLCTTLSRRATLDVVKSHVWLVQGPRNQNMQIPDRMAIPTNRRPKLATAPKKPPPDIRARCSTIDAAELGGKPKIAAKTGAATKMTASMDLESITSAVPSVQATQSKSTASHAQTPSQPSNTAPVIDDDFNDKPDRRRARAMSNSMNSSELPRNTSWRKRLRQNISSYLSQESSGAIEEE